jgi:predicted NBD/HSP70 family sugar kinase
MPKYVCVDMGGTAIKYGLSTEQGEFIHRGQKQNQIKKLGVQQIITDIANIVKFYQSAVWHNSDKKADKEPGEDSDIVGLAVATAGIVDPDNGTILYSGPSFPGYSGFNLKAALETATGLPCTVENDVNAAGLGESWLGAGKSAQSMYGLMIGTGIGGCLIINNRLVRGAFYSAGEVGYQHTNRKENWEETASARALVQKVAQAKNIPLDEIDGKKVFALAKNGDKAAQEAVENTVAAWAVGIANICYIVNPDMVIIGGGITAERAYLQPILTAKLQECLIPLVYEHTQVTFSQLGDKVGLLGALRNFLQRAKK